MPKIDLSKIPAHQNEPKMHGLGKGFLTVPSVGMRLAPEVLLLELFREAFFSNRTAEQTHTRELDPDLRSEVNEPVFGAGERAVITALRGRRKQTKWSRENPFFAPAYPALARNSWLSKKRERVIVRLLFEGALAQHFWSRGEDSETGRQRQVETVTRLVSAFEGLRRDGPSNDILACALEPDKTVDTATAQQILFNFTSASSPTIFETEHEEDELAARIAHDLRSICDLEKRTPRHLWARLLMTYLRFALPIWLLAQMRITCLVHRWLTNAFDGAEIPNQLEILQAIGARNRKLIFPTLTPTHEVFSRIAEYIRCRVELNIALFCLEQLQPDRIRDRKISTCRIGAQAIRLVDALELAKANSTTLRSDAVFEGAGSAAVFLGRSAEKFRAWCDPLNKGQGKNIDEFLRVLYRSERGDEAGGYLLVREGRGKDAGFQVFPGKLLLQTITFLASREKHTGNDNIAGGGRLVLQDIEDHFAQYGIDFSLAADARPLLMAELQALGLLKGSPDAGSSVAVSSPF